MLREGTADLALDQRIMEEEVHTYRVPDKEEGDAAEDDPSIMAPAPEQGDKS